MPTLTIDGVSVTVEPGTTVLQACEAAGKEIPRFCYHERLSIAGNCRMCLVEQEKSPKPIASCAMPAMDKMVIHTDTPMVRKARQGVMEFLLINHPLDCPICDQGGECDLQDQAMGYGVGHSRYEENKRAVPDKFMGPLVKTVMTRCIHCTRCIRFLSEVAGTDELGAVGRGEDMAITTYLEKAIGSELSGNIIDLCPVGALTSKPYAFSARSWELRKCDSVDVMDAVGASIRVDARGREVMRILPRTNDAVNEEWLDDRSRFAYDGLKRQRLDRPYVRVDGKLKPAAWSEALGAVASALREAGGERIAAIAGDVACAESLLALRQLWDRLQSPHRDCRQDGARIDPSCRAGYLFNSTIEGIETADALLLIGTNPRQEAALINARIRKRWRRGGFPIGLIGPAADLTYRYQHLGEGPDALRAVAEGRHPFAATLQAAKRPMLILGQGALRRADGAAVLALARQAAERCNMAQADWNGFNMLHMAAARVAALDLGFVPGPGGRDLEGILAGAGAGDIRVVYLLGADEFDMDRLGPAFVVYQGSHGDRGAHRADVILPGAAYTEKSATYVNTEGRVQRTTLAAFPPGDAREDWTILRALSGVLGRRLPFDSIGQLQRRLFAANPRFQELDSLQSAAWAEFGQPGNIDAAPFALPVTNFYMTDPISRASETMAQCSEAFGGGQTQKTGTHG
jgi:NADH-quinone oxidoreductase subunit G